ncbi:hypothetical protein D9M68_726080 [compost metagenome]
MVPESLMTFTVAPLTLLPLLAVYLNEPPSLPSSLKVMVAAASRASKAPPIAVPMLVMFSSELLLPVSLANRAHLGITIGSAPETFGALVNTRSSRTTNGASAGSICRARLALDVSPSLSRRVKPTFSSITPSNTGGV